MPGVQDVLRGIIETREVVNLQIDQEIATVAVLDLTQKKELSDKIKKIVHRQLEGLVDRTVSNL